MLWHTWCRATHLRSILAMHMRLVKHMCITMHAHMSLLNVNEPHPRARSLSYIIDCIDFVTHTIYGYVQYVVVLLRQ